MKRVLISLVLIVLVIGLAVAGCAETAPAPAPTPTPTPTPTTPTPTPAPAVEPIDLKWTESGSPASKRNQWLINEFANRVEKDTQGRVKVTHYWAETLGKQVNWWDMVKAGAADMASLVPVFYRGKFPLNEIGNVPFLMACDELDRMRETYEVHWDKYLGQEYADAKVLYLWATEGTDLISKKPIRVMEDFKGVQMGCPMGPMVHTYAALGATPAGMPIPEIYMALERGIVDGWSTPVHTFMSWKLTALAGYVTLIDGWGLVCPIVINWDTWNRMTPADQQAMEEIGKWAGEEYDRLTTEEEQTALAHCKEVGVEVITLTPEEKARWKEATAHLQDEWAVETDEIGLPGTELLNAFRKFRADKGW